MEMSSEASLLPMDFSDLLSRQEPLPCDDPFLRELINNQNSDLFSSLFEATDRDGNILGASLDLESLMALPTTSPESSEGYTSETSSASHHNALSSPTTSITSTRESVYDQQNQEDSSTPPSPLVTTTFTDLPMQQLRAGNCIDGMEREYIDGMEREYIDEMEHELEASHYSASPPSSNSNNGPLAPILSDIRIDVDYMVSMRESISPTATPPTQPTSSSSERKAATLHLSDEEKKLLLEEGIMLPTDMLLTKAEQKHLKRIQRKIKNKISAQESRKRKKDYVDGLEDRVKLSTERNHELSKEVGRLQTQNSSLMNQLKELQNLVTKYLPSKVQAGTAGTILMVTVLSFSLFLVPNSGKDVHNYQISNGYARKTRTLLFTETDVYGNVIDPNNGDILSVAGGHTPLPLPPWLDQTPVVSKWMNTTLPGQESNSPHQEKGEMLTQLPS